VVFFCEKENQYFVITATVLKFAINQPFRRDTAMKNIHCIRPKMSGIAITTLLAVTLLGACSAGLTDQEVAEANAAANGQPSPAQLAADAAKAKADAEAAATAAELANRYVGTYTGIVSNDGKVGQLAGTFTISVNKDKQIFGSLVLDDGTKATVAGGFVNQSSGEFDLAFYVSNPYTISGHGLISSGALTADIHNDADVTKNGYMNGRKN
jgi:hypothetical protein